ncbi:putative zinc-binding metallopeptidase [Sphingobacterium sp. lm-10]|uniref:substrate import-associated zinc metallohydrolase lipoprotein n=1 Tax=Sphingobacterium sp. lm-10 TaxID=2944904 RepID=UPI00202193D7|nr:substrate import-associated zinc metallohydrolase lipoprotein [Sphingobacterium sp. lm-10]MCL7988155.1 putative zinc-binding metallopeptidase [Sphingobacterium sp. lm-10]
MKSIYIKGFALVSILLLGACRDNEQLDIDLSNYDTFAPGPVDDWIRTNLTDHYNIDVVYRYQRNMHDVDRNVSPPDQGRVIPQMSIVLEGFLKLYEKVGGTTFIKTYTPKQFALFGSGNYRPDGVVIAGTADAGRRITLYGLNGLNETNAGSVLGNLGVVHHEFVHILNQIRFIPPSFEQVSRGDYFSNWNSPDNPESLSRSLGFVSQYARQNIGEDFAETMSSLIVNGQIGYNKYAAESGEVGQDRLKRKEAVVRDYMEQNFEINLTELQYEFAKIMSEKYNSSAFTFNSALASNAVSHIVVNNTASYHNEHGRSQAFQDQVYGPSSASFAASGQPLNRFEVHFQSSTKMTIRVSFGGFMAYYDFDIANSNGRYTFTFSETQGTGTVYNNGNVGWVLLGAFPILEYFSNNTFIPDWFPRNVDPTVDTYLKYAGFSTVSDPASYFYGEFISR